MTRIIWFVTALLAVPIVALIAWFNARDRMGPGSTSRTVHGQRSGT